MVKLDSVSGAAFDQMLLTMIDRYRGALGWAQNGQAQGKNLDAKPPGEDIDPAKAQGVEALRNLPRPGRPRLAQADTGEPEATSWSTSS